MSTQSTGISRETIRDKMVGVVKDMTADWDTGFGGAIAEDTRVIGDLSFESIDVVHLVVAIEKAFDRTDLPFEELLMADGRYVDDLSIRQVVDFLSKHLS